MRKFYCDEKNALDEIAERRELEVEQAPLKGHDAAIDRFRYLYPDLMRDPRVAPRFLVERELVKQEALKKGESIDWDRAYRDIGDKIRAERR